MKKNLQQTLDLNQKQKEFYNDTKEKKPNFFVKTWRYIRNNSLETYKNQYDLKDRVYEQHKIWLGDLSHKKVLDLGCLRGNALSIYMAKNAKKYVGIDLSDVAIEKLNQKLEKNECTNAVGLAVDFLSPEFTENQFDVIYAYGVLHHFENFELLVAKLKEKLAEGGIIISHDPMETSLPIKAVRALYRPFQDDKDWEWPFTKQTLKKLDSHFHILDQKGILGASKYGILYQMAPIGKNYKSRLIRKRIEKDWEIKSVYESYSCMQLSLCMQKK